MYNKKNSVNNSMTYQRPYRVGRNKKTGPQLFACKSPDELQTEIDNGGIVLPSHHTVAGAKMWWAHQVETTMRAQFGKTPPDSNVKDVIEKAVTGRSLGFRGGFISLNALRTILGEIPAGPYIARQLALNGYFHTVRCNTSPAELRRFPEAPQKSRIYHDGTVSGSPARIMALYDAAQRADMPLQPRQ